MITNELSKTSSFYHLSSKFFDKTHVPRKEDEILSFEIKKKDNSVHLELRLIKLAFYIIGHFSKVLSRHIRTLKNLPEQIFVRMF